jgi:hypothetical protein
MVVQPDLGGDTRSAADRRHQRTAITMLVLAGLVLIAGLYAWESITDPDESSDSVAAATCQPAAPTDAPPPAEVELNVYNATDRNGLASSIAGEMRTRGFTILDVANDPSGREITGTAEVRAHLDSQAAASLVMAQVPGAVFVTDNRTDGTVDLVVGAAFEALAPPGGVPAPVPPADGTSTPLPSC